MVERSTPYYWLISLFLSVLAITVITVQWSQAQRDYGDATHIIRNGSDLEAVLDQAPEKERILYRIPTGFFIQSLAFVTPSDINVTGYVWQHYPKDFPDRYSKGFVFPEEVDSFNTTLRETYRTETASGELIGWYFDVTVRQSFDYAAYPLDYLTIWLRLWPANFNHDKNILFVPDFNAYHDTGRQRFGLDRDIVPGEWEIDETFFSYSNIAYDTNFGYSGEPTATTYQEFFFNLGARRKFISAFIINLVPLFVVAILLFAALMTLSGNREHVERFGSNTTAILGTCSALFFVVLLAHIQVRSQFAGSGLVYIEYFYLVMYCAILLTALNAYLFSLTPPTDNTLLHYRDNLWPKVAFWPVLLWSMALLTWLKL